MFNFLSLPNEIKTAISKAAGKLSENDIISKIYLYGSYAKGTFTPESDIDIAVFLKDEEFCTLDNFKLLNKSVLSSEYDIQLQVFSEDELKDPCGIIEEVLSFGVLIYNGYDLNRVTI